MIKLSYLNVAQIDNSVLLKIATSNSDSTIAKKFTDLRILKNSIVNENTCRPV